MLDAACLALVGRLCSWTRLHGLGPWRTLTIVNEDLGFWETHNMGLGG